MQCGIYATSSRSHTQIKSGVRRSGFAQILTKGREVIWMWYFQEGGKNFKKLADVIVLTLYVDDLFWKKSDCAVT